MASTKGCKPGKESVQPRQFIYDGTAKQRNAEAESRRKELINSEKKFNLEQRAYEKKLRTPVLGFVERQHQVMYADFQIYVCGVDVTPWVAGSLSVVLSGRDGMNTASFNLQNANDNFVLNLRNLRDPNNKGGGWRIADPHHIGSQYSELAKYQIFKAKNKEVDDCFLPNNPYDKHIGIFRSSCRSSPTSTAPNSNDTTPGDAALPPSDMPQDSGFVRSARQWPLDPNRPIFHKHDPVRIFMHNPTTESDSWLPAFTGFIDSYSFDDDYTNGQSEIKISCYDIRGAMAKMRVAKNIRSSDSNINSLTELADGSLNSSFFKDLLVESAYTSFVAYRSLKEIAEYLIAGKGFRTAVGPKNDQAKTLTQQVFTNLSSEARTAFTNQKFAVQDINIGDAGKATVVLVPQNDPSGVGNFKIGIERQSQKVLCNLVDNQIANPELAQWYYLLLLGLKRSPSTGDPVGEDGKPLVQSAPECDTNVAALKALEGAAVVEAWNNMEAGQLSGETERLLEYEARQLIDLTPDQEQAFNSSAEGSKKISEIIGYQTQLQKLDDDLSYNKKELDRLRQRRDEPVDLGSSDAKYAWGGSGQTLDQRMTDLIHWTDPQVYDQQRSKIDADVKRAQNELNHLKAKWKREHPIQDPNSPKFATPISPDSGLIVRTKAYSFAEIDAIGKATTWKGAWSPWNGYLHYYETGEGNIKSLIDVSAQEQFENSTVEWEDRAAILNELTQKLDYQWWVTPIGDIVFEFPMYDFFPTAFGEFATVLTFDKHLKSANFTDETQEIPTLFIGQGSFSTRAEAQEAGGDNLAKAANRVILFTPTLASRIGVVPIQETFPSFVGDNPVQALPGQIPQAPNIPTAGEIQEFLNKQHSSIPEPQWIQDLRFRITPRQGYTPDVTSADYQYDWYFLTNILDQSKRKLGTNQLRFAQAVANYNGGGGGVSQQEANSNLAQQVAYVTDLAQKYPTADSPRYSVKDLESLRAYLGAYSAINSDFTKSAAAKSNTETQASQQDRRAHIRNWSILDFQRRLANAATFDQQAEFRPFVLPNKPIYSLPRQRIGLSTTVTNTMEINQICGTDIGLTYMKHQTLLQDGSLDFTHIAGGKNAPVDYSKLLFSKTNGIVPIDEAIAPISSTPESASYIDPKSTSTTVPTTTEEANGESSMAAHYENPKPAADSPVAAANSGVVTFAGYFDDLNGNVVMVDHADGSRTIIPNLKSIRVQAGDTATSETIVGTRDPQSKAQNIKMDCNNNASPVPSYVSDVSGLRTSSAARNPPPVRSTSQQASTSSVPASQATTQAGNLSSSSPEGEVNMSSTPPEKLTSG